MLSGITKEEYGDLRYREGFEEGLEQGLEEGFEEGLEQAKSIIIRCMRDKEYDSVQIAAFTGYDIEDVEKYL